MYWLALFAAIISNAIANIAFKKAVTKTPIEGGVSAVFTLASDPWMWLGAFSACVLLGCYLYALKGIDISIAYPAVTGFAMLGIVLAGVLFLGETLSIAKVVGIFFVLTGVLLLKQST